MNGCNKSIFEWYRETEHQEVSECLDLSEPCKGLSHETKAISYPPLLVLNDKVDCPGKSGCQEDKWNVEARDWDTFVKTFVQDIPFVTDLNN